jgi:hypothetical protein
MIGDESDRLSESVLAGCRTMRLSDGEVWADAIARMLERLDAACTTTASG